MSVQDFVSRVTLTDAQREVLPTLEPSFEHLVGAGNAAWKSRGLYCAGTASCVTKLFVYCKILSLSPGLARSVA